MLPSLALALGLLAAAADVVSSAVIAPAAWCPEDKLSSKNGPLHLFTFGDSYTTTDFQHTGQQPSAVNPFGNPVSM